MKITNESETILEIAQSNATLAVDREAGVIRGVKILGRESANGRSYTKAAIEKAAGMYEGRGVYTNHPSKPNDERQVQDRFGWLEGVTVKQDGLYGNLQVLKSHTMASTVFEIAERNPALFGLSHNATGKTRREGGRTFVEEIQGVRSVDLVTEPATTQGLFESKEAPVPTMKDVIESLDAKQYPEAKAILEAMEDGQPMAAVAETPVENAGPDAMKAAFRAAVIAAFDDESLDTKATLKKIGDVIKAYDKLTAKAEEPAPEDPAAADPATAAPESKDMAARLAKLEGREKARDMLENAGIVCTDKKKREAMIESLSGMSSDETRKTLLETWGQAADPAKLTPRSGTGAAAAKTGEFPKTPKEFAESIR